MKLHAGNCHPALRVLFHVSDSLVFIGVEDELLLTRDREKSEHVTTGKRGHKSFLGIHIRRIAKVGGSGGAGHGMAAVKAPSMIARIFRIGELGVAAFPTKSGFVFGHSLV